MTVYCFCVDRFSLLILDIFACIAVNGFYLNCPDTCLRQFAVTPPDINNVHLCFLHSGKDVFIIYITIKRETNNERVINFIDHFIMTQFIVVLK
jgi:hypothetical protein